MKDLTLAERHSIRATTARLTNEFARVFGPETIQRFITDSLDQLLPEATVSTFVPIFVERLTRERLEALARVEGKTAAEAPTVLFLCVHNAGRSQMAAGWLRHLAGYRVSVYSGGSEPANEVNPAAIEVMSEVGIDIRAEFPKPWTDEVVRAADIVVSMGCGDACPHYPGKKYEDWVLEDPAGHGVETVRLIRDDIRHRVEALMADLGLTVTA